MRFWLAETWQATQRGLSGAKKRWLGENDVEAADGHHETRDPQHEVRSAESETSDRETPTTGDTIRCLTNAPRSADGAHGE